MINELLIINASISLTGVLTCLVFIGDENKNKIWKAFHKSKYYRLMSRMACGYPIANFDSWLENHLWDCSKERLLDEYNFYLASLRIEPIYWKAPKFIQEEVESKMTKMYKEAYEEIDEREKKWERMSKKA